MKIPMKPKKTEPPMRNPPDETAVAEVRDHLAKRAADRNGAPARRRGEKQRHAERPERASRTPNTRNGARQLKWLAIQPLTTRPVSPPVTDAPTQLPTAGPELRAGELVAEVQATATAVTPGMRIPCSARRKTSDGERRRPRAEERRDGERARSSRP